MAPLHNARSSQTLQLSKSPVINREEQEENQAADMIAKVPAAAPKKNGAAKKTSTSSTGSKKRKAPPTTSTQQEEEEQQQPQPKRQKKQPQPKRQKKQPQPKRQKKEAKAKPRSPLLTPSSASAPETFSGRSCSPEVPRPEPAKSKDQEPSVGGSSVPVKPESSDDTPSELEYPTGLLWYRKTLQSRRTSRREAKIQKWLPLANQLMAAHVEKLAELRGEREAAAAATAPMESCESREQEEVEEAAAAGAGAGAERLACCPHREVEPSDEDDSDDDDDSDSDDEDDWWHGKDLGWSRDEGMEYRDRQPVYGNGY
ncbi:hypothetical protein GE21DRAFT_9800 [Neurospora crassa]|uniref:Uncharacterized protein n=1 Tax=Neurospora crassa (strain ATCC 24698 / 74-OR23-1A / CBS 708.71 / DSM 1257 / FGSC 987) TaxID=367110 RepID=Q7S3F7_NEUCR|nr:hypothetical protein NCU06896 [Neurospora crassa OR74A]EAA30007.1 hypothetical protein NCU06896 [Neurospora crassa OR74A]KHE82571.1 hypothetical protein GE21DRAFT_9800 [Neurospora crassa]|eukprot:XP_959243.1 hypothetical protein NCU06896 [Neurospora crassa OR74A]